MIKFVRSKEMKCCICGENIVGYGNNPQGAVDQNSRMIKWKNKDRCCHECNRNYVLPGRLSVYLNVGDAVPSDARVGYKK